MEHPQPEAGGVIVDLPHGGGLCQNSLRQVVRLLQHDGPVITQEFAAADRQDLHMGVGGHLPEHLLEGAGAEIEGVVLQEMEPERAALGLIAVRGEKEPHPGSVEKFVDLFRICHD